MKSFSPMLNLVNLAEEVHIAYKWCIKLKMKDFAYWASATIETIIKEPLKLYCLSFSMISYLLRQIFSFWSLTWGKSKINRLMLSMPSQITWV